MDQENLFNHDSSIWSSCMHTRHIGKAIKETAITPRLAWHCYESTYVVCGGESLLDHVFQTIKESYMEAQHKNNAGNELSGSNWTVDS